MLEKENWDWWGQKKQENVTELTRNSKYLWVGFEVKGSIESKHNEYILVMEYAIYNFELSEKKSLSIFCCFELQNYLTFLPQKHTSTAHSILQMYTSQIIAKESGKCLQNLSIYFLFTSIEFPTDLAWLVVKFDLSGMLHFCIFHIIFLPIVY